MKVVQTSPKALLRGSTRLTITTSLLLFSLVGCYTIKGSFDGEHRIKDFYPTLYRFKRPGPVKEITEVYKGTVYLRGGKRYTNVVATRKSNFVTIQFQDGRKIQVLISEVKSIQVEPIPK